MIAWTRAIWIGFFSWLIPFVVAFAMYPLKKANARCSAL